MKIKDYSEKELQEFLSSYLEAASWADCPEENIQDGLSFDKESFNTAKLDCEKFLDENYAFIKYHLNQAGHDFWLTRQHHGSGFWDRPEMWGKETAKKLTKESHKFPERSIQIEQFGGEKLKYLVIV